MDEAPGGSTRTVNCKGCRRTVEIASSGEGHPWGWYNVTIGAPRRLNSRSGKSFRRAGLYCSVACLAGDLESLRKEEERQRDAYEHE